MTYLDKQEFHAWAYDDLLTNTTRGVLAEYIVATALGVHAAKRVEWDKYDLEVEGFGVEVKSSAYVQSWEQTRSSTIEFDIRPVKSWDARTNTYAPTAQRCADVYVFCLLNGEVRDHVNPLDVEQWTFYVLATSVLDRKVPEQKKIRLAPLTALGPKECKFDELGAVIREVAVADCGC